MPFAGRDYQGKGGILDVLGAIDAHDEQGIKARVIEASQKGEDNGWFAKLLANGLAC